ncbi:MAG TPA: shikimate dehydrogenase [Bacteroidota bacterium]|nr:shikimate dehydrogenase [Bacteroidota bacterium]
MIIVSITGPSSRRALEQMKASESYADIFELRLDLLDANNVASLFRAASKPILATCRSRAQGGNFAGTDKQRFDILSEAVRLGAPYVDVELAAGSEFIERFRSEHTRTRIVLSVHCTDGEKIDVRHLYASMRALAPFAMKLAYVAQDAADIAYAVEFLALARNDAMKAIAVAMGEYGEATRILYRKLGGWATFASPQFGAESAPGQIPARLLKTLYRADTLNASSKVFGVIGNPLRQSKGVFVHNPLFEKMGMNAVYCRFPVADLERFMTSVAPMLSGFSVTIPHKQSVMQYLDLIDDRARAIGAVNTVVRRRGKWYGTNTDASGALDAIERGVRVKGKRLLVVGAGGAARAIAYEAKRRGADILIANRTDERAKQLALELGLTYLPHDFLPEAKFDILANATPVGMVPDVDVSPVPARILKGKIVFDAVYNPPVTKLLRDAQRAGAKVIRGTEMYLNQAALQFELYTGRKPSPTLMRKLLTNAAND